MTVGMMREQRMYQCNDECNDEQRMYQCNDEDELIIQAAQHSARLLLISVMLQWRPN